MLLSTRQNREHLKYFSNKYLLCYDQSQQRSVGHANLPQNHKLILMFLLVIVDTRSGVLGFLGLTVTCQAGGLLCELHCLAFPTCHRLSFFLLINLKLWCLMALTQGCALRKIVGSSILGTREIQGAQHVISLKTK